MARITIEELYRGERNGEKYGVSMSQIALAWHFAKGVAAPIVGALTR